MQLNDFAEEFGLARADAENWLARVELRTDYQPTARGRSREFSRENVVELAMIASLVAVGFRPSKAVVWAEIVVDEYRNRRSAPEFLAFPAQKFERCISGDEVSPDQLAELAALSPFRAAILINSGDVVRRVESLFTEAAL